MAHNSRKNRIFGPAVLLFMAIALAVARAEEIEMTPLRIELVPLAQITTAHRVVLVGDPPRLMLSARPKKGKALALFEIQGHTVSPLATIPLRLPSSLDFDLVADPDKGLSLAYEYNRGATSEVWMRSLGTGEALNLPPPKRSVSEHRPRFVRGGGDGGRHQ